jgi:hypothetical protein
MTRRSFGGTAALLAGLLACSNAGANLTLPALANGRIAVGVYLDRNATHVLDAGDTVFGGVRLALLVPGGTDTLQTAVTNAQGIAIFDSVAIGTYRLVVDRHALGDSIGVVAGDTGSIRLTGNPDSLVGSRVVRLGFAEMSIAQVRTQPAGKRVIIHGKVISARQFFRDSSAFVGDTSGNIRITNAIGQPGSAGNNIGDSVLVLGTTGQAQGQGILSNGLFTTIALGLAPLPKLLSVADALTAQGGADDAALVQVSNVVISDTVQATPDFIVKVSDAGVPGVTINVLLDQLLNAPHSIFPPGRTGTFRGVLIPAGDGTWILKPRTGLDVVLN